MRRSVCACTSLDGEGTVARSTPDDLRGLSDGLVAVMPPFLDQAAVQASNLAASAAEAEDAAAAAFAYFGLNAQEVRRTTFGEFLKPFVIFQTALDTELMERARRGRQRQQTQK